MAFRDLLVLGEEKKVARPAVEAAMDLAARSDAHVTLLRLQRRVPIPGFLTAQLPNELMPALDKATRPDFAEERAAAEALAKRQGITLEWRERVVDDPAAAGVIALHARYADLLVAAQPPEEGGPDGYRDLVETLLPATGRPVLLVPSIGAAPGFGRRILVAWDGGREATRAVADALPLLTAAEEVEVAVVDAGKRLRNPEPQPGAAIALHLSRHGAKATVAQLSSGGLSIGDVLLNRVADRGFDLIVMGAYAHSRLRDLVLGGVTQHLLRHMTVPLFTAH